LAGSSKTLKRSQGPENEPVTLTNLGTTTEENTPQSADMNSGAITIEGSDLENILDVKMNIIDVM
jgi:hypothetical protein